MSSTKRVNQKRLIKLFMQKMFRLADQNHQINRLKPLRHKWRIVEIGQAPCPSKRLALFSGFHLSLQACYFQILCQSLLNCSSKYSLYSLFSSAQQSSIPKRERREIDAHLPLYPKIHWRCDVHVAVILLVIPHTQKQIGGENKTKQNKTYPGLDYQLLKKLFAELSGARSLFDCLQTSESCLDRLFYLNGIQGVSTSSAT